MGLEDLFYQQLAYLTIYKLLNKFDSYRYIFTLFPGEISCLYESSNDVYAI